ncbi:MULTISPECIES: transporter substrate-binding domain-containing protein [unclassified Pseudomonas]|uniref:transporter substrate-binding domain-containing protein n=1 Tax=unclassified Pseudomonas TaxID=196821 RepID=UPI0035BFAB24
MFAEQDALRLLGRSQVTGYQLDLAADDARWLRAKGTLRLGISAPDYPPFDLTSNHQYEGISADYAALVAELLQVRLSIHRYDSRAALIGALKRGEIDLLSTANGFEAQEPGITLSTPYSDDQPVLVTRTDDKAPHWEELAGKTIAMLNHYLPAHQVQEAYPNSTLRLYPSTIEAINAVAFGKDDVYLGDAISANYLINRNYLNNLRLTDFAGLAGTRFAFAVTTAQARLLRLLDQALQAVPHNERITILRRWGAFDMSIPGQHLLNFDEREERWMQANPRVTVMAVENFRPITFFNEQGEARGIAADLLAKVALRTGLQFEIRKAASLAEELDELRSGKAQVIAALTPSNQRASDLRFTRPYLNSAFVLVSRKADGSPDTLDDLGGKSLALIRGNYLAETLAQRFPNIRITPVDSSAEVMERVAKGQVDAGVNSLPIARYLISRQYPRLQITSTVGSEPARFSFAVPHDKPELHSILEKALLSISPEEMGELTTRWRNDVFIDNSYWQRNREAIVRGFLVAGALLLLALAWIIYLRRQIRRRVKAEQALGDQLEFMRVLIDETPHPIYVRDRKGHLLACNSGYLSVLGVSREQVMGKSALEVPYVDPGEAAQYHAEYLRVMAEGTPHIQDRQLTLRDGQRLTIYHWVLPYRSSDGAVIGMICGWIDISERQHLLDMVQEANRAKTTFLATMSHEIRTPINAVVGMLELALKKAEQGLPDQVAIETASDAAHGLLELIGDILDIARIETGKLSLTPKRANLLELLRPQARIFEGLAKQKRLPLVLELDPQADRDVLIDPLRFKQVVSNLLSNAIKFTEQGQVRLSLQVLPESDAQTLRIHLRVEDTGVGISDADQKKLFSPYTQASSNTQSARTGSGLGLVICRTLCDMMGGQLQLQSVLGQGTQLDMRLDLPLLKPLAGKAAATDDTTPSQRTLDILVADDYPTNRLLLRKQLGYLGHQVSEAEDGAQALQAWREGRFDVLITDCNMPVMNGYDLARAIRRDEALHGAPRCTILGFTANALPDEKERCLEAGMDDCLFKPITLPELAQCLGQAVPCAPPLNDDAPAPQNASCIDLAYLEKLVQGDGAALHALLTDLAASVANDRAELGTIVAGHDFTLLKDIAHRIRGGARLVRAQPTIEACAQVEAACATADKTRMASAAEHLKQEMSALAQALQNYLENA